jgi:hypothetical protein
MIVRILNPNNLPQALVNAASPEEGHTYDKDRYSITDLIGSPWQRHLKMKHSGEVEVDVEDMTWLLMGKAFHLLMEKHSPKDAVAEHKIVINYKDVTLVGIPDLYHNGTLYDFKVTSVYSFLLGEKIEWEQQLNCYVWMLKSIGIDINKVQIIAVLKDYMVRKAAEEGYPNKPLIAVDIPLWSLEDTETYINKRIEAHKLLEPCSPEERWNKPTTYAVKMKNVKTAKRVLQTHDEAAQWMANNVKDIKNAYIEERQGEDSKCLRYCNYSKWCQYNRYLGVETNE